MNHAMAMQGLTTCDLSDACDALGLDAVSDGSIRAAPFAGSQMEPAVMNALHRAWGPVGRLARAMGLPGFVLAMLAVLNGPAGAQAQTYPAKPIRIVVPVATGGIADYYSRVIGARLTEAWGQTVVVENRTGGGGNIGADIVAKAAPDGYTLLMGFIGTNAVNQFLFAKMPFDTMRDFAPVAGVIEAEGLLAVHPSLPVKTVTELVAYAKAQPGKLAYVSGGVGTSSHLAGELFKSMTGTFMVHVPYRGNAPAITDLIGGQAQLAFATLPTVIPHVRAGSLRGVAVIGSTRSAAAPNLPTVAESGVPGFVVNNWIGLFAPAGTPPEVIRKLNAEVMRIMQLPDIRKRMDTEGERHTPNTPEQYAQFVRDEVAKWSPVIKAAGIKAE